jgi:hypothetical protein
VAPLIQALEQISRDETIDFRGIAVTGDLTNSPSDRAFANAAVFVDAAAEVLKLGVEPEARRQRVWVVDGNHDYRVLGNVKISSTGIESGGHFRRLQSNYDETAGHVLGINTGITGLFARGVVTETELSRIANT